jgi:hypothetical protein
LFIVVIIWHIYYNWKPIKNYLKVKKELKIFTKEFNVSAILVSLFVVGTLTMTLPFSFFVNIGNGIKAKNAHGMKTAPFEYAEQARFCDFCIILSVDEKKALKKLKKSNIIVTSSKEKLLDIALSNNTTTQAIYDAMADKKSFILPSDLPIGIAHKTLTALSHEYGLDIKKAIKYLKNQGITITKDSKFKRVSKKYKLHPAELYAMLLASQK